MTRVFCDLCGQEIRSDGGNYVKHRLRKSLYNREEFLNVYVDCHVYVREVGKANGAVCRPCVERIVAEGYVDQNADGRFGRFISPEALAP